MTLVRLQTVEEVSEKEQASVAFCDPGKCSEFQTTAESKLYDVREVKKKNTIHILY